MIRKLLRAASHSLVLSHCLAAQVVESSGASVKVPYTPLRYKSDDASKVNNYAIPQNQNNPVYPLYIPKDFSPVWKTNLLDFGLKYYRPVISENRIFLIDRNRVIILDTLDGRKVFDYSSDYDVENVCSSGKIIYMITSRSGPFGGKTWVSAYDTEKKQRVWETDLGLWSNSSGQSGPFAFQTDGSQIYTFRRGPIGGRLVAFSLEGKENWEFKSKGVAETILFTPGRIILEPERLEKVVAIDRITGKEVWSLEKGDGWSEVAMSGSEVLIASRWIEPILKFTGGIKLIALDGDNGKQLWFKDISAKDGFLGREVVYGFTVAPKIRILQTSKSVRAFDSENGQEIWQFKNDMDFKFVTNEKVFVFGDKVLVFQTKKNTATKLRVFNSRDGSEAGTIDIEDELLPGVKVVGNRLFMTFRHGLMMALPLLQEPEVGPSAELPSASGEGKSVGNPSQGR